MKKNILILSSALLFGASVLMIGCKKDDTTAPVVTLTGADAVTISLQGTYSELGATANDDEDGTVSVSTTGTVDPDKTGTYTITYTATDAAGNEGSAARTVTVKNDADYLAGNYTVTQGAVTWTQTVTVSNTINKRVGFSAFAAYLPDVTSVTAQLTGNELAVNTITTIADGCQHEFVNQIGGNPVVKNGAGKWTFSLKYTDETKAGGAGCAATLAIPYSDVFVQQ